MSHQILTSYRRKSAYTVSVGLLAFSIISAAAVVDLTQTVEDDLRVEIKSLVASQEASGLTIEVDGQNVVLSGQVTDADSIDIIRSALRDNNRVHQFELQLKAENSVKTVVSAKQSTSDNIPLAPLHEPSESNAPASTEPELRLLRVGTRLMVSGSLPPSQTFDATIEDLSSALQINNTSTHSHSVKPALWLESIIPVITTLPMINGANLEIKNGQMILNGSVDSQATLNAINARIADVDQSQLAIHSNFWIEEAKLPVVSDAPLDEPNIVIDWHAGTLNLSGVLSSEAELLKISDILMTHYKPQRTTNALTSSEAVSPAPWIDELVQMLPGLQALETAHVAVAQGKLTLSGESGGAEMPAQKSPKSQQQPQPLKLNNEIVMLDVESESTGLKLRQELDKISLDQILFASGAAVISQKSFQVLDELARILTEFPDVPVIVAGHTDSLGKAQANQTLSQLRANAVRDRLVDKGVNKNRVSAVGYGESQPIESNDTPTGRALNRRIEINY